jgi:hypothetical protein
MDMNSSEWKSSPVNLGVIDKVEGLGTWDSRTTVKHARPNPETPIGNPLPDRWKPAELYSELLRVPHRRGWGKPDNWADLKLIGLDEIASLAWET